MPNWCENRLIVRGDKKEVLRFIEKNQNDDEALSLEAVVPRPEGIEDRPHNSSLALLLDPNIPDDKLDWYNWSLRHWGTKWDLGEVRADLAPGQADYRFMSAWSPPIAWLEAVAKEFPALTLELIYCEPGNAFAGRQLYEQGRLARGEEFDCCDDSISEEIWA